MGSLCTRTRILVLSNGGTYEWDICVLIFVYSCCLMVGLTDGVSVYSYSYTHAVVA